MKQINLTMQKEMDDDYQDLLSRLILKKDPVVDPAAANKALLEKMAAQAEKKSTEKPKKDTIKKKEEPKKIEEQSYDQIAFALKSQAKLAPIKPEDQQTDKEKALARKKKLLALQQS